MNLEEKVLSNSDGGKSPKIPELNDHSKQFLSSTRRSNRIRKSKVPVDCCTINEAIITNISTTGEESSNKSYPNIGNTPLVNYNIKIKNNEVIDSNQESEKTNTLFQMNDNVDSSIKSMFDGIFNQSYNKTFHKLLPNTLSDVPIKERKFYKSVETSAHNLTKNYSNIKTKLPTDDVSKVFKIISKPSLLRDVPGNAKLHGKLSLKTYSNKRKSFERSDVVESFGLPDYPIATDGTIKPILDNKLDADILDASEITILDLQKVDEPWVITNIEGETLFPYYEEVRIKAEPDPFGINSSFLDVINTENLEESDMDFFTSTPVNQGKVVHNINSSLINTPKNNVLTIHKSKEIDIEAIKVNFRNILKKTVEEDVAELEKVCSHNNTDIVNKISYRSREIPFAANGNLVVKNKRISNKLSKFRNSDEGDTVVASTSTKKFADCSKNIHKANISGRSFPSNKSKSRRKAPSQNNYFLKAKGQKNKKKLETCNKNKRPKKKNTDTKNDPINLSLSKKSLVSKNSSEKQIGIMCNDKLNIKKQKLTLDNGHTTDFCEILYGIDNTSQTTHPTDECTNKQSINNGLNQKVLKKVIRTRAGKVCANKRVLRSAYQDTKYVTQKKVSSSRKVHTYIKNPKEISETKNCNLHGRKKVNVSKTEAIINGVRVNCDNPLTVNNKKNIFSTKYLGKPLKGIEKRKNVTEKEKNVLTSLKCDKPVPEVRIVVTPLDLSQLSDKLPNINNKPMDRMDFVSPTKQRLRSFKTAMCHIISPTKSIIVNKSLLEHFNNTNQELQGDCKHNISNKSLPKEALLLKDVVKNKEELNSTTNDNLYKKNSSKDLCVSIEVFNENLNCPITDTKLIRSSTPVTPKEEMCNVPATLASGDDHILSQTQKIYCATEMCGKQEALECLHQQDYSADMTKDIKIKGDLEKKTFLHKDIRIDSISSEALSNLIPTANCPSPSNLPSNEDLEVELLCKNMSNRDLFSPTLSQIAVERQLISSISESSSFSSLNYLEENNSISPIEGRNEENLAHTSLVSNIVGKSYGTQQINKTNSTQTEIINSYIQENRDNLQQINDITMIKDQKKNVNHLMIENISPPMPHSDAQLNNQHSPKVTDSVVSLEEREFAILDELRENNTIEIHYESNENVEYEHRGLSTDLVVSNSNRLSVTVNTLEHSYNKDDIFCTNPDDQKKPQSSCKYLEAVSRTNKKDTQKFNVLSLTDMSVNTKNNATNGTQLDIHNKNELISIQDVTIRNTLQSGCTNPKKIALAVIANSIERLNDNIENHFNRIKSYHNSQTNDALRDLNLDHLHSNYKQDKHVGPCAPLSEDTSFEKKVETVPNINTLEELTICNDIGKNIEIEMDNHTPVANQKNSHEVTKSSVQHPDTIDKIDLEQTDKTKLIDASIISSVSTEPNVAKTLEKVDDNKSTEPAADIKHCTEEISSNSKPGRLSRRKSLDNLDSLNKEQKKHKGRLKRSKSVAPCISNMRVTRSLSLIINQTEKQSNEEHNLHESTRLISDFDTKSYSHHVNGSLTKNAEKLGFKRASKNEMCDKPLKNQEKSVSALDNSPELHVGDIAWAQIGSHPFWPCLVTKDPETKRHKKIVPSKRQKLLYHVRFFGDKGRRAWINTHQIMKYNNKNDLHVLFEQQRIKKKISELRAYIVAPAKLQKWQIAIDEVELLKSETYRKKLAYFNQVCRAACKKVLAPDRCVSPNNVLLKRKRKENSPEPIEQQHISTVISNSSPSRKKLKSKPISESVNIDRGKHRKEVTDNNSDILEDDSLLLKACSKEKEYSNEASNQNDNIENENSLLLRLRSKSRLNKMCKEKSDNEDSGEYQIISRLRSKTQEEISLKNDWDENKPVGNLLNKLKKKHPDDILETDSKTVSDNIINMSLYSMETQKDLFKRNNLFKGISRDKVCQYCLKPGTVLKCRGRCNGTYHTECATKILVESVPKRKKSKIRINMTEENCDDSFCSESTTKSDLSERNVEIKSLKIGTNEYNLRYANKDKEVNTFAENSEKVGLVDHVQIITVPSSVYNTPPRKTFPPNFKNMTLAEQIDYKMKEIMKKFESRTVYSSVETNSYETTKKHPQLKSEHYKSTSSDESVTSSGMNTKDDKDSQNLQPNTTVGKPDVAVNNSTDDSDNNVLLTLETPVQIKHISRKSNIARKSLVRHVTADFEESDIQENNTEENKLNVSGSSTEATAEIDPKNFKCGFCTSNSDPFCFICCKAVAKRGSTIRQKCSLYQCGRFYHPECLKLWPQTQWSLIQTTKHKNSDQIIDSFVCPLHVCHTCVSDDPRAATSRCSGDKIVKCLRCPSTYHSTNLCVPAGTTILSSTQILCPRHRERTKACTINTTWCFLCSEGGNLICCETCPTSVHPECLPVNLTDDDKFICEDCESGRLPLYDEIVWVKLGNFRWWPALILFPNEVPANVMNTKHSTGEFVVRFFGTYDYYWVSRGRSFLFQEGDTGHCNSVRKKVDAAFNKAVEEAVIAHKLKKEFKQSQEVEPITSLKPPPYIRIKVNKPVGNVRQLDLDLSSTTACDCDPSQPYPCGPDSDCLNRLLLTECNPDVCPAGNRCKNQSFEKREYPPMVPYKTQGRGWGLKTLASIKKGQFVVEYVGELIDMEEYQRRIQKMHAQKEENYYFLTIDKDRMLDAGPKGNVARFMNHCCQPNCETQKWTVNGDTRVGLFATDDIPVETELTFNYNLECVGKEKKVCKCGAPNCSGFIGVKAKQDTETKKLKKPCKKKVPSQPIVIHKCFICGKKNKNVAPCNNKICNKAYHLTCLRMSEWPEGNKFVCPWHNCNICSKRTIRCCVKCINSFCPSHSEGNVRYDNLLGFVCSTHDPTIPKNKKPVKSKKKTATAITDETVVTSTTFDDFDGEDVTLTTKNSMLKNKQVLMESESEVEFSDAQCSRFLLGTTREMSYLDYDSQDEGNISSATLTDGEEDCVERRKRRCTQKSRYGTKRSKKSNLTNEYNTASSVVKNGSSRDVSTSELSSRGNELENR